MRLPILMTYLLDQKIVLLAMSLCLLSACGQKGPLYLPTEKPGSSTAESFDAGSQQYLRVD